MTVDMKNEFAQSLAKLKVQTIFLKKKEKAKKKQKNN